MYPMQHDYSYIISLGEFPGKKLFEFAKKQLDERPDIAMTHSGCVFVKLAGIDWIAPEFEVGTFGKGVPEGVEPGGSVVVDVKDRPIDVKRYRPRYSRSYSYASSGSLKVLAPEYGDLYLIQTSEIVAPGNAFVQHVLHRHTLRKERILDNAGYAIFRSMDSPFYPVGAIIYDSEVFVLGNKLSASLGTYKEIMPSMQ